LQNNDEINCWLGKVVLEIRKKFQDSLDGEMKRLTGQGYRVDVKEAQAFTEEQE
jgi:hypothetical protein